MPSDFPTPNKPETGMVRLKEYAIGDIVRVKAVVNHSLPPALEPGATVVVVAWGIGSRAVMDEAGCIWELPMVHIDPGMEVYQGGKWVDYRPVEDA